jgi:hypothetical protein
MDKTEILLEIFIILYVCIVIAACLWAVVQ